MNIVVTNDDGYSAGLEVLLGAARRLGNACAVIPEKQKSAVSGAMTLHKPLRINRREEGIYELSGTPADCVLFSLYSGELPKPDIVFSGINWGDNAGMGPLIGSGTLGACWQGMLEGIPGIAFSRYTKHRNWRDPESWGDRRVLLKKTTDIAGELIALFDDSESFFSVNFPDELRESTKTIHTKRLQKRRFTTNITRKEDPNREPYYWISGNPKPYEENTDLYEIAVKKNISITRISLDYFE